MSISQFSLNSRAIVLYDFEAESTNELTIQAQEIITIAENYSLKSPDELDGWILVSNQLGKGLVPVNYLSAYEENQPDSTGKSISASLYLQSFKASPNNDSDSTQLLQNINNYYSHPLQQKDFKNDGHVLSTPLSSAATATSTISLLQKKLAESTPYSSKYLNSIESTQFLASIERQNNEILKEVQSNRPIHSINKSLNNVESSRSLKELSVIAETTMNTNNIPPKQLFDLHEFEELMKANGEWAQRMKSSQQHLYDSLNQSLESIGVKLNDSYSHNQDRVIKIEELMQLIEREKKILDDNIKTN